jgi:hypothetical protein
LHVSVFLTISYYVLNLLSAVYYRQFFFCLLSVASTLPFLAYFGNFVWAFITSKWLVLFGVPNLVPITQSAVNQIPLTPHFAYPNDRSMLLHNTLTSALFGVFSIGLYYSITLSDWMNIFCFKV